MVLELKSKTQPSTLSLSARLRFFSSLSDTSIRSSGSYSRGSPPYSSIDSSSNGSSCTYLTTQRNTGSTGSFNSLTSTPMDYTSTMALESPSVSFQEIVRHRPLSLQLTPTGHEHNSLPSYDHADAASAVIKPDIVKTSPFLQGKISNKTDPVSSIIEQPITPTSMLTPTMKRIKLKIIGKLMLPRTFQSNDRNNNIDKESKLVVSDDDDTVTENGFDCSESEISMPPKKIGKIKSLFIENCNQLPQRQTLPSSNKYMKMDLKSPPYNMLGSLENSMTNGHFNALPDNNNSNAKLNSADNKSEQHHSDESSNDSGKENIDVLVVNEHTKSVVETRRKFSRKPPNSNNNNNNNNNNNSNNSNNSNNNSNNNQSLNHGNLTSHSRPLSQQLNTNSMIENGKSSLPNNPLSSNKFAKYFGETMTTERQKSHGNFTSHSRSLSQQLSSNSVIENGKTSFPNNQLPNKFAKYFGETMTAERQIRTTLTKSKSFSSTNTKLVPDVCQVKPQTPRNDIIKESYDVRRTPSIQTTSQRSFASLRKGHLWSNCTPMQQHSRRGIKRRSPVYQKVTNYDQIIVTEDELKNADQAFDEICRTMNESEIQQFSEEFDKLFKNIL
uniref:Uncharacterized protein n=1 Tax=Glossina austeni TaxID=7395 RepID=A0A1A9VN45_GLOAU